MHSTHPFHFNLVAAAHASMIEHGFQPDFPAGTETELAAIQAQPAAPAADGFADLRGLLWSSIDNDTSKDLDQIEWAEQLPDGRIRVLVGVADVDARVPRGTVIDKHAQCETTSVYTGVSVFPMLPTELSEGITSLNENQDRVAVVIEFAVDAAGTASEGKAYRALVRNRAQLAYPSVGAWLEGKGAAPAKVAASSDLAAQLKLQDTAAQRMEGGRFQHGALDLETIETHPVMLADQIVDMRASKRIAPPRSLKSSWWRPTASSRAALRTRAWPPSAASCARPSAGTASWSWPRKRAQRCPPIPIRRPSTTFSSRKSRRTPITFPIFRWPSSSSWGPANTYW